MSAPSILLYSKAIEVTAGLYSVLADFCDVEIAKTTEQAGDACRRVKFDLLLMHCSGNIANAVEEYQTFMGVCPGVPCVFLAEDSSLVDFSLRSFHPPAAAALGYPLTTQMLVSVVEKVLGIRLKRKPSERFIEEQRYPLALILSSGGVEAMIAEEILQEYCETVMMTSTLDGLRFITKRAEVLGAVLISADMKNLPSSDPKLEETIGRIRDISPKCPIVLMSWKKDELQKISRNIYVEGKLTLNEKEGFLKNDLIEMVSKLIQKPLTPIHRTAVTTSQQKKVILVVDDEKGIRAGIEVVLGQDYQVLLAANAEEGIAIYQDKHRSIDLVILDFHLPDRSGPEVMLDMKKIDRSVPIIILTGAENAGLAAKTLYLGISAFLMKPVGADELTEKVREAIIEKEQTKKLEQLPKMLVIDDTQETVDVLRVLFLDYRVESANTGKMGIEMVRREKYDVVALDYRLPDIMGVDVLREIKAIDKSIRVIAVTIERDAKVAQAFIKEGVEKVLYKPLKHEEVEIAVRGRKKE